MLILTYITPGYAHWFFHLHLNLRLLGLEPHLHVCTSSPIALPIENLTVLDHDFAADAQNFGSYKYGQIVNGRHDCILRFYRQHSLLFLDTDVTLFRSPIPYLRQHDVGVPLFLDDSGPFRKRGTLNNGCMYLPQTAASIEFMDAFVVHLRQEKSRNDQDVLNKYRPRSYGVLNRNLFSNGYRFYENRHKHPVSRDLILLHHNWISGDAKKWERARSFDCVLNETSRRWFSSMLQRSSTKPRWKYRRST